MGVKQVKINVNELSIGMFVSGLDRPWTQTPFPLQGFYIRDHQEISDLKVHCNYVYIDVAKGAPALVTKLKTLSSDGSTSGGGSSKKLRRAPANHKVTNLAPLKITRNVYPRLAPLEKEIGKAKALNQQVFDAVGLVMAQVDRDHQQVSINETRRCASEMVDSVIRNPDAFTWLTRIREKDEHTYSHSVRASVWAILFGRHLGLSKSDLDILAMGVLLKDIGKTKLSRDLLRKDLKTEEEQEEYEKFIDYGIEILRKLPDVKPRVTSVVKTHCERVNGSGFPMHLQGDKIPLLGKIAGIVTYYDEVTNPRGVSFSLSPSKAVAQLYNSRGEKFQDELVVEFIRAIGLYPTGTVVELSTGEIGVVVEQNFERRLKPTIMVVIDACKEQLYEPYVLDLAEKDLNFQSKVKAGKALPNDLQRIDIVQDVKAEDFNVDVEWVRDLYINQKNGGLLSLFKRQAKKIVGLYH